MQTFFRCVAMALFIELSLQATAAEKYALLIGVAKYDHAEMNKPEALQFPEEDATALGELLKSGGYEVELLLGKAATQAAIKAKLTALQKKADAEGVVLIGLFGHGVEVDTVDADGNVIKDGCFCPFDTAMREALDFKGKPVLDANKKVRIEPDPDTLIKLGDLMRTLKLAKAGNRIVLADCCRTTPNAARGRSSFGANFSVQDLPENTSLLFGCSPNEQAFEHKDWGHGAFTKCLLDAIAELSAEGPVDTAQLASQMKKRVPALVASVSPRDRQTPKPFITDVVDLQLILKHEVANVNVLRTTGMKLQLIPAGKFLMGSDDPQFVELHGAKHAVEITRPFYMQATEVTQQQWTTIMGTRPWIGKYWAQDGPMRAVTHISWKDAQLFCEKLSNIEQKTFRLPTEAEWEYSCRAGATGNWTCDKETELPKYAWFDVQDQLPKQSSSYEEEFRITSQILGGVFVHEVGQKKPNAFGMYDMHGNVSEFCCDSYVLDAYKSRDANTEDPLVVQPDDPSKVLRGGHFASNSETVTSYNRMSIGESDADGWSGFRVVCESP